MSNFLTVKELSSFLNLHPNTIYKMAEHQEIPFIKRKGVGIRFREKDIEAWLDKGSLKIDSFIESFSKFDLSLDRYDKLFLKGGRMSQKRKIWKYPFGSVYLRLTKTGKESWYIYYRANGERIRQVVKNAQSRTDALKVLQVNVADAFRGEHGFKKQEKRIKFKEYAEEYIENYAKVNKRSWKTDEYMLKRVKEFFNEKCLHEIDSLLIDQFRASILKEGITKSTANRYMALLKSMFNLSIEWGYLKTNPVKVKFFSEKDNLKERILSREEEQSLLEACSTHLKPIVLTALHTGMRKGEILNLKWSQVDFTNMVIKVENTKSGKPRFIPINGYLLEELMRLKKQSGKSNYVFLYPDSGKPLKDVKRSFPGAVRRSGIRELRFHDLRHTFASRLVAKGVDLITIKELLGHHSVRITERYTHSYSEQKKRAVERLTSKKVTHFVPILSKSKRLLVSNGLFSIN